MREVDHFCSTTKYSMPSSPSFFKSEYQKLNLNWVSISSNLHFPVLLFLSNKPFPSCSLLLWCLTPILSSSNPSPSSSALATAFTSFILCPPPLTSSSWSCSTVKLSPQTCSSFYLIVLVIHGKPLIGGEWRFRVFCLLRLSSWWSQWLQTLELRN